MALLGHLWKLVVFWLPYTITGMLLIYVAMASGYFKFKLACKVWLKSHPAVKVGFTYKL
jgi:hypothetical protein